MIFKSKRKLQQEEIEKLKHEIKSLQDQLNKQKEETFISLDSQEKRVMNEAWEEHMASGCTNRWLYYRIVPTGFSKPLYLCCDKCGSKRQIK